MSGRRGVLNSMEWLWMGFGGGDGTESYQDLILSTHCESRRLAPLSAAHLARLVPVEWYTPTPSQRSLTPAPHAPSWCTHGGYLPASRSTPKLPA